MNRCTKCIMPENYPRIEFDEEGTCNFCNNPQEVEYLGPEALKRKILSSDSDREYDCVVGFSGGRDSSYLLYYLSSVLDLNVVALSIDNGYLPSETKNNIENIANRLNVDLVEKKYPYLEDCFTKHLKAWLHNPSPAMLATLCVGCRLGLAKGKYEFLKDRKIPYYVTGATPFEGNMYKTNLLRFPRKSNNKISLILGYLREIARNPKWANKPQCFLTQMQEFLAYYGRRYDKKLQSKGTQKITPFKEYIKWDEDKIVDTLENQLDWQRNESTGSTWRGDCEVALLKQYLYIETLGYNEKDDSLSDLIRDGQISRQEALRRLNEEQFISEDVIRDIVEKNGIDYTHFSRVVNNISE